MSRSPLQRSRTISTGVATVAVLLLLVPGTAHAYLDAASGSMIIQAVVTAVAGGLFLFRSQWRRLKSFFSSEPSAKESEESVDGPQS